VTHKAEFFQVREDGSYELGSGPFTYVDYGLMDQDGIQLKFWVHDQTFQKAKAVVTNRGALSDRLFIIGSAWFLISQAACEVLKTLRCCDSIRWIETAIYRKDGTWLADYRLAYGGKRCDVWDYSRSDFYWQEGKVPGTKEAAGYMREGVLDLRLLPPFDLFETENFYWIGTRRLRAAIESQRLTGFEFKPVKT